MTEAGQCTRLGAAPPSGVPGLHTGVPWRAQKLLGRDVFGENFYPCGTGSGLAITIAIKTVVGLAQNRMIHRRPRVGRTLPVTPWAPMTRPPAAEVFNEGFAPPFSDQACAQEQEKRQVVAPLRADHPEVRTATRGSAITALATAASPRRRLAATREHLGLHDGFLAPRAGLSKKEIEWTMFGKSPPLIFRLF